MRADVISIERAYELGKPFHAASMPGDSSFFLLFIIIARVLVYRFLVHFEQGMRIIRSSCWK